LDKLKFFLSPLKSLPFNDEAAEAYGKIRADLEKKELLLDRMICK